MWERHCQWCYIVYKSRWWSPAFIGYHTNSEVTCWGSPKTQSYQMLTSMWNRKKYGTDFVRSARHHSGKQWQLCWKFTSSMQSLSIELIPYLLNPSEKWLQVMHLKVTSLQLLLVITTKEALDLSICHPPVGKFCLLHIISCRLKRISLQK
jgi:hypothetical protein